MIFSNRTYLVPDIIEAMFDPSKERIREQNYVLDRKIQKLQ